jgi:hypothetical protein
MKGSMNASENVRRIIERAGERVWTMSDFPHLPAAAVAQALSRLARAGVLNRLARGCYHMPRQTSFGPSRPHPRLLRERVDEKGPVFPAGLTASNLLGFSTQAPRIEELATPAGSLPRNLLGQSVRLTTRRPDAWGKLNTKEAALLDFLRRRGETSELTPNETVKRVLGLLREEGTFRNLLKVSKTEPPRVRALLGALGEELGQPRESFAELKKSLNSLSRFDFGLFSSLPAAQYWQAKDISEK